MVSQCSISVLRNFWSESVGTSNFEILVEDSDTGSSSSITVRMEYLFAFQSWYCELCVEKAESIVLLILFFGSALIVGGWGVVRWDRKSYLGPAEIESFSSRDLSRSNKYDICPLPCLVSLSQSTGTQITISINTFICFKYYTVWDQFCY